MPSRSSHTRGRRAHSWGLPGDYGIKFFGCRITDSGTSTPPTKVVVAPASLDTLQSIIDDAIQVEQQRVKTGRPLFRDSRLPRIGELHDVFVEVVGDTPFFRPLPSHILTFTGWPTQNELHPLLLELTRFRWKMDGEWPARHFDRLSRYFIELVKGTFLDRNKTRLPFGLSVPVKTPKVTQTTQLLSAATSPQIAAQLVYVLVEFLGDVLFGVPIFCPEALLPKPPPIDELLAPYTCHAAFVIRDDVTHTDYLHDIKRPAAESDPEDYAGLVGTIIAHESRRAEGAVKAAVGALDRGFIVGLNNEVLSEIAATAISVLCKKATEQVAYKVLYEFITTANIDTDEKTDILKALMELYPQSS